MFIQDRPISLIKLRDVVTSLLAFFLEFLATDPEVPGSIPGATRFTEK
jgi:hypothetical protein